MDALEAGMLEMTKEQVEIAVSRMENKKEVLEVVRRNLESVVRLTEALSTTSLRLLTVMAVRKELGERDYFKQEFAFLDLVAEAKKMIVTLEGFLGNNDKSTSPPVPESH